MYRVTFISPSQQNDFDVHIKKSYPDIFIEDRRVIDHGKTVQWIVKDSLNKIVLDEIQTIFRVDVLQRKQNELPIKLFLADMDATIVEGETLDDLAERAGIKDKVAAITQQAMVGELNFESALTERVMMLKDLPASVIDETVQAMQLNKGAEKLLAALKSNGIHTILVSGGFLPFTGAVAKKLGFDAHFGNDLIIENNKLTGAVAHPILGKDFKRNKLIEMREAMALQASQTIAIGDGANDLPMLSEAGTGIGYYPKPLVQEAINNVILYTDLSSLIYLL